MNNYALDEALAAKSRWTEREGSGVPRKFSEDLNAVEALYFGYTTNEEGERIRELLKEIIARDNPKATSEELVMQYEMWANARQRAEAIARVWGVWES